MLPQEIASLVVLLICFIFVTVGRPVSKVTAATATGQKYFRLVKFFVIAATVFSVTILLVSSKESGTALIRLFVLVIALAFLLWAILVLLSLFDRYRFSSFVRHTARLFDYAMGFALFVPIVLLAAMCGVPHQLQTRLMWNDAFSRGIAVNKLLHATQATSK